MCCGDWLSKSTSRMCQLPTMTLTAMLMYWMISRLPLNPQCRPLMSWLIGDSTTPKQQDGWQKCPRNIGKQEDALAHLRTQREALTQAGELLDVLWQTLWDKSPFDPLGPDAMLEWLESRSELLAAIERRADATSLLEIQRKEEHESKEELLTELSTLGINRATLENDILPVTLERADSVRRDYEQKADTKVQLAKSLQEAVTGIERRRRELTGAKQEWSQWKEEWSAALGETGACNWFASGCSVHSNRCH